VAPARSLGVGLLGRLHLELGARTLGPGDLGGRKPKQLLEILLVHQGEPVPKDRIADLLWGESLPRDPMRTVEAYVSVVRSKLDPDQDRARAILRREPAAYRVALEDARVDLREFDDLVARALDTSPPRRRELRLEALALCRGPLLDDEPYSDWALPLREMYAERRLGLLLDLAQDELDDSPAAARGHAEAVLREQPTRERAHRIVIAAHYLEHERDRALDAYTRGRDALRDLLGVSPLAETERLYLAVLNEEAPARVRSMVRGPAPAPVATRPTGRVATHFARHGDATIAYQAVGDGTRDVVFAPGWFSHVEVGWEERRYRTFLQRLARRCRVLVFDKRGVGMSDPAPADISLDDRADDVLAVMDAAGSERAVVFGVSEGGPMGVSLAARRPDRVAGLVLYASFGRLMAAPDYPWGWTPEFLRAYQDALEQVWTTGRGIELALPTAGDDEALVEWASRYLRLAASPATARAVLAACSSTDVRAYLGAVDVPTLVLHRRDEALVTPANGRYVAEHIPGARFVELAGADHWPWIGDADSVLDAVDGFLDGLDR
jgi:pimeloyl-ACP methyl ester carboxylesterase/DNA-binding SARP family transcriptional activator